ncbi:MAG: VWA domain-containing protein [Pyrinomonadaceae bacterium]
MKKCFAIVLTLLFAAANILSQDTGASPKPTPPDDDVVKISTNLIQIDVSVTDAKGKPITDIRPEEVEIYENGEKQTISNFSFVSSHTERSVKPAVIDKTGVPIPQGTLSPEQIRRTIALVVDDLSLSFESAYQTRRGLKKFVDEQMQDGDLVAIIRTGAGIGALQQFTSDKRILYAAIEKVKWNPQGGGGISAFAPIESAPDTSLQTSGDDGSTDEVPAAGGSGQSLDDFRTQGFVTGTLGALRYIVTGMGELPGRKSVILFSDGFRILETDESGISTTGVVLDFMRALIDQANRSSVVFYTIDARGLVFTGFTAADSITNTSPEGMNRLASARRELLSDTQAGLSFLAEETGGLAIKNNNDLSGGVRRVLEDQSYYLIAYEPDSDTFDAAKRKYNKLEVKVSRKGATARYRSGFFNVADRPSVPITANSLPLDQLETALVSPFAVNGLNLRLNALFGNDRVSGSFVRSLLFVDGSELKFTDEKDGMKKAVFDVMAMSFGDNGQPIDKIAKTYTITAKAESLKKIMKDGFVYHFQFPVKKPGAYQFRVALRDAQGGKIGSASQFIEVPDLKKERLSASSVLLENLSVKEWESLNDPNGGSVRGDPMTATALRRVKLNTVLRYGFEIYNAKFDNSKQPSLTTKVRVYRDGKLLLDGKDQRLDPAGQTDLQRLRSAGALVIGGKMLPGDYILQIIVTDGLAKPKQQIATQFVQFEVVE